MTAERQWQMRRLSKGDYLLPANSVEHTGRVYRMLSWVDGPHLGAERTRTVWSLFVGQANDMDDHAIGLAPWEMREWREVAECGTRGDAIVAALDHDERLIAASEYPNKETPPHD